MIDDLGGATSELARLALDAAWLRHQVIANNIANVNTPGYVAKKVDFEEHLAKFLTPLGELNESAFRHELESLKAFVDEGHAVVPSGGEEVSLDKEMVMLTENVLRYQALLDALSKRGSIMQMAIKEGR